VLPATAGVVSNRIDVLQQALRTFVHDLDEGRAAGLAGREAALARFSLDRFLADWDDVLGAATA